MNQTLRDTLHILLGAGLLAVGVVVHALYVFITRPRAAKAPFESWEDYEWKPVSKPSTPASAAHAAPAVRRRQPAGTPVAIPVQPAPAVKLGDTRPLNTRAAARQQHKSRVIEASAIDVASDASADVIDVLTAAGYNKTAAKAAVASVDKASRGSVEDFTRAALRAARGMA